MSEEKMNEEMNFEKAFARLEEILDHINSGNISLDESLKLYEEADSLIVKCAARLNAAEQRIETLIKKRDGSLELDDDEQPLMENADALSGQFS